MLQVRLQTLVHKQIGLTDVIKLTILIDKNGSTNQNHKDGPQAVVMTFCSWIITLRNIVLFDIEIKTLSK